MGVTGSGARGRETWSTLTEGPPEVDPDLRQSFEAVSDWIDPY